MRGPHSPAGDDALNTAIFLRFLRRLIKGAERKIILILDNLKVHHAKAVAAWVAARSQRIELVVLPRWAPEHNPDEFLHHEVKQRLAQRPAVRHRPELKRALASILHRLQKIPARIRTFFQAPTTRYAPPAPLWRVTFHHPQRSQRRMKKRLSYCTDSQSR